MCTDFFREIAPDGTQPNLNTAIMKKYIQILPPSLLQNQFAEFVEKIEAQKSFTQKITCRHGTKLSIFDAKMF